MTGAWAGVDGNAELDTGWAGVDGNCGLDAGADKVGVADGNVIYALKLSVLG